MVPEDVSTAPLEGASREPQLITTHLTNAYRRGSVLRNHVRPQTLVGSTLEVPSVYLRGFN